MSGTVHVLGAGLAGLSAAVKLAAAGTKVVVYEAAGHAGGRCRSFHDTEIDAAIDNGNHLVLSGNHAVMAYLDTIGAEDTLDVVGPARFPFLDLQSGLRWTVEPDRGRIPWSLLSASRRVPGASLGDYLRCWRLAGAGDGKTIESCMKTNGALWDRFWAPIIIAVMNTDPALSSAGPMWRVIKETLALGEAACRPAIPKRGLSHSFVDPALAFLQAQGAAVHFNERIRGLGMTNGRISSIETSSGEVVVASDDRIISALPASVAADLIPDLQAPDRFSAIVNGHFRLPVGHQESPFLGLINATAEWLFVRDGIVSVTVSAADDLALQPAEQIAETFWGEICKAYDLGNLALPAHRVIKERRATFLQTPDQIGRRPDCRTQWGNLFLAGDWTDTSLPATIEGTLRSGFKAAAMINAL